MPFHFSIGAARQAAQALHLLNERGLVLPLEPLEGRPVHADFTQWPFPRLGILTANLGGVRHGARAASAGSAADEHVYMAVTLRGASVAEHRRQELVLRDGDATLLSPQQDGFSMAHPGRVDFLGLRLSRAALAPLVANVDDAVMRPIRRGSQPLGLLTRYIRMALDESVAPSSGLREVVASHVYELAALALGAARDAAPSGPGIRAARVRAMKADILARLEDCDLSVVALAARHRVTPRYVHKLFESEGISFSEFVLEQRLARVYRNLTEPRFAGWAISTLAYDAGFGDLSYFNRAFHRRYGATPSDIRRSLR